MTFETRLRVALARLARTGILKSNYAPPLYHFLWNRGVQLAPPHFNSFAANFFIMGGSFGAIFGVLMTAWAVMVAHMAPPGLSGALGFYAVTTAAAGTMFGLVMATYYTLTARGHRLPRWQDLRPEDGSNP